MKTEPTWHPLLATRETRPGLWHLTDPGGRDYGTIEIRRTPDGPRYRCVFRNDVIGWATSLKLGCERIHAAYLRSHGPQGGPKQGPGT